MCVYIYIYIYIYRVASTPSELSSSLRRIVWNPYPEDISIGLLSSRNTFLHFWMISGKLFGIPRMFYPPPTIIKKPNIIVSS